MAQEPRELTGTIVEVGNSRGLFAVAETPEGRAFLPGSALRKRVNGSVDYYASEKEREIPSAGTQVVIRAFPCKKDTRNCGWLGSDWAEAGH